jgi:hypothetical protein
VRQKSIAGGSWWVEWAKPFLKKGKFIPFWISNLGSPCFLRLLQSMLVVVVDGGDNRRDDGLGGVKSHTQEDNWLGFKSQLNSSVNLNKFLNFCKPQLPNP